MRVCVSGVGRGVCTWVYMHICANVYVCRRQGCMCVCRGGGGGGERDMH